MPANYPNYPLPSYETPVAAEKYPSTAPSTSSQLFNLADLELAAMEAQKALQDAQMSRQLGDPHAQNLECRAQMRQPLSQQENRLQATLRLSEETFQKENADVVSQAELEREIELMQREKLNSSYDSDWSSGEVNAGHDNPFPALDLVHARKSKKDKLLLENDGLPLHQRITVKINEQNEESDTSNRSRSDTSNHGQLSITNTPLARAFGNQMSTRRKRVRELSTPYLDHYSHMLCWWTQHVFTVATLVLFYFATFHAKKESFIRTFFVVATASLAYYAKCSGLGEANLFGNERVPWVRYVDWILTTPIMLAELCHIGHAPDHTFDMIIGCDLLMLSCGIASALIPTETNLKEKCFFYLCGSVFFAIMVFTLHRDVANGSAKHQSEHIQELFQRLEILTVSAWSLYPVVCGLGRAHMGVISVAAEDAVICVMDMTSKIGMEALVIASVMSDPGVSEAVHEAVIAIGNATVTAMTTESVADVGSY